MNGRESGPGAVVEELAKTDGEQEITENGVVQAGEEQRSGGLIGEGEKEPADRAKAHGQPVPEDDVDKRERQGAGEQHSPTTAEQRLVAMKEECPVKKFLRVDGKKGVEEKNKRPEPGRQANEGKEELRRQEVNRDSEAHDAYGIANEDGGEERPEVTPRSELRKAERLVTPQQQKRSERSEQNIRNRQIGNAAVIDEQGNNYKNSGELDGEKK